MNISKNLLQNIKMEYQVYLLVSLLLDVESKIDYRTKSFVEFVKDYLAETQRT